MHKWSSVVGVCLCVNCFDNWMHCILLNSLSLPDEMGCHKVLSTKILCVPILGIVHNIVLFLRSGFLNIACNVYCGALCH